MHALFIRTNKHRPVLDFGVCKLVVRRLLRDLRHREALGEWVGTWQNISGDQANVTLRHQQTQTSMNTVHYINRWASVGKLEGRGETLTEGERDTHREIGK